ncbi:MAG: dCTP deaminase [Thermodesulfobacteriota bacterium]
MTTVLAGEEIVLCAQGLISAKKQQGPAWIDLTVKGVSSLVAGGSLDFGGSEYQAGTEEALSPEKKDTEEPYGWWNLDAGTYLLQFNETIPSAEGRVVLIVPHERLLAAGCSHGTVVVARLDGSVTVPLHVGPEGLSIKENARVSKALLARVG